MPTASLSKGSGVSPGRLAGCMRGITAPDQMCQKLHNESMRTAGIRKVRRNLSAPIEQVKNGREITITDRGKPVATLSTPKAPRRRGLPDMSSFRSGLGISPDAASRLAELIPEERDERV